MEKPGLETDVTGPVTETLTVFEFLKDMNAMKRPLVELVPKAREFLVGREVIIGGQQYKVLEVSDDFSITGEMISSGMNTEQRVVVPWDAIKTGGIKLAENALRS